MNRPPADFPRASSLADTISDGCMRALFVGFVRSVSSMHKDIKMQATDLELRMLFRGSVLCRVVPYRELMHVQIGDCSGWEIRVRDEDGCLDALDMAIRHFLRMFSSIETPSAHSCPPS